VSDRVLAIVANAIIPFGLGVAVVFYAAFLRTEADCLAAGYTAAKIDYKFTEYCIKRIDQTDVVVRLKDIQK
jgi:hypothetical protein